MLYGRVSHPIQVQFNKYVVVLQPQSRRNGTGLGSFHFARHYSGNHCYFLFLCVLRCFSSAGSRFFASRLLGIGCPIQKSPDQFIFANPRSLSQLITSFFASESQGIPRVPFLTFFYKHCFCSVLYAFWSLLVILALGIRHY